MAKPFPTFDLSRAPDALKGWTESRPIDPTIRSEFANGDIASRARFTTALPKLLTFTYSYLTYAEKEIIADYEDHIKIGSSKFDWRNPITNEDWEMRLIQPIDISLESGCINLYYAKLSMFGKQVEKMRQAIIRIEDLAADADIANRPIFVNPKTVTIESVGILTEGAPAGIDNSNTAVIAITDDASNSIVTKTYNAATQPPSSDYEDLGNLDNASLNAGEHLLFSLTQGTNANMPAFSIIIEYYYT
jgi:hypothetical protein